MRFYIRFLQKPPCSGTIHDQVVSPFTLNIIIILHILPVIIFLYLLIKNLSNIKTEHVFLYIESVNSDGLPRVPDDAIIDEKKNRTLKDSLNEMLHGFDIKFQPRKVFNEALHNHHQKKDLTEKAAKKQIENGLNRESQL